MTRTLLVLPMLALVLSLGACFKSVTKVTIANDATGTVETSNQFNAEAIESMMDMVMAMAPEGEGDMDQLEEAIDEMKGAFDAKKMEAQMKKAGIEVSESKAIDQDGWKGFSMKGKIADVNKAVAEMRKKMTENAKKADLPAGVPSELTNFSPRFLKTADPKVGKIVILPSMEKMFEQMDEDPFEALDEMPDEMRDMMDAQIETFKEMFMGNELDLTMEFVLPGELVSVTGAKKTGAKSFKFTMKGKDLTIDNAKGLFGIKKGISATFKIPEGCKIVFADPNAKKDEKGKDKEKEKNKDKKKGGLKIGG